MADGNLCCFMCQQDLSKDNAGPLFEVFSAPRSCAAIVANHVITYHMWKKFSPDASTLYWCWCGEKLRYWAMVSHFDGCGGVFSHYLEFHLGVGCGGS